MKRKKKPFAEAVIMAEYLKKNKISDDRILLKTESATTKKNIVNSRKLMETGASVGIVTNNFHVFRAVRIARKQGLKNVCGIAAGSTRLYLPHHMLREFFAKIQFLIAR